MTDAQDVLARVLEPGYLERLEDRTLDDVRAMHVECVQIENSLSYVRRIAQGRLDILTAETERRSTGGSLDELLASLPTILGGSDEARPPASATRMVSQFAPAADYELPPELERVLGDDTLAKLSVLSDAELGRTIDELSAIEQRVSADRRALHGVIDRIERDLAARLVVEA